MGVAGENLKYSHTPNERMSKKTCQECQVPLVSIDAIDVCPECYGVNVDSSKWKGKTSECPSCKQEVKLFGTPSKGHVFHCQDCNTVGNVFFESDLHKRHVKIAKTSKMGKKLSWMLEVPCQYWPRKDEVVGTVCTKCPIKEPCDAHTKAIGEFCKGKEYEVYVSRDFFEIVHK